jgi:hypothetical protein
MARLHLDSLAQKNSQADILEALEKLPKGLEDTYDEVINRIWSQDKEAVDLAGRVLMWISYAQIPLTVKQLQHAIAVTKGSTELDQKHLPHEKRLISVCAGIVTIDQEGGIIRLVHYTTQQYFEQIRERKFPNAQTSVATACLTYLNFNVFADGPCKDRFLLEEWRKILEFGRYAALFWGQHTRGEAENKPDVQRVVLSLLASEKKKDLMLQMATYAKSSWGDIDFTKGQTLLHVIAKNGLATICRFIFDERNRGECKDTTCEGPSMW